MRKLSVRDLTLDRKRVLVRVDFNVPLDDSGRITDETRIKAALPTIKYILKSGGHPIVMSHLGRPKGNWDAKLSLAPCATRLAKLLGSKVIMAPEAIGPDVERLSERLQPGEVLLLENLRFHKGEEHPDKEARFVEGLARLGDCYVNDAFGTAHRAHASTVYLPKLFPGLAAMGFLLEREVNYLGETLLKPKRPFVAIIGGAKVSSKLGVLGALADKTDTLMIGGGMAFTFLKAQGIATGDSLVEHDLMGETEEITKRAKQLLLPKDFVIAHEFCNDAQSRVIATQEGIPSKWMGLDVGPLTLKEWEPLILGAGTVFWNGPLGVFEFSNFAKSTFEMAHIVAQSEATTIVGGGDSVAAVNQAEVSDTIDHISTGGGAALEFVEYGVLPGIVALSDK